MGCGLKMSAPSGLPGRQVLHSLVLQRTQLGVLGDYPWLQDFIGLVGDYISVIVLEAHGHHGLGSTVAVAAVAAVVEALQAKDKVKGSEESGLEIKQLNSQSL